MEQLAVVLFLIIHGFVHAAVWAMPKPAEQKPPPFDPAHSWALEAAHVAPASMRATSVIVAWVAALLYAAASVALAVDAAAWTTFAVLGAGVGLVLKGLWFNRWLSFGVALDVAVIAAVAAGRPTI